MDPVQLGKWNSWTPALSFPLPVPEDLAALHGASNLGRPFTLELYVGPADRDLLRVGDDLDQAGIAFEKDHGLFGPQQWTPVQAHLAVPAVRAMPMLPKRRMRLGAHGLAFFLLSDFFPYAMIADRFSRTTLLSPHALNIKQAA